MHCYAEALMDHRHGRVQWGPNGTRSRTSADYWRKPIAWDRKAREAGERRRVFCASLADVFEDRDELYPWRLDLARLIWDTPNLDWLLLTKRPENASPMLYEMFFPGGAWPKNYWLGATVEDQNAARGRIRVLLDTPASVHFLSVEPMLGPIDLGLWRVAIPKHRESWPVERTERAWVICGGESGPGARPFDLEWARDLKNQCETYGVPFFMKQTGTNPYATRTVVDRPDVYMRRSVPYRIESKKGDLLTDFPIELRVREFPRPPIHVH
jgi:protein gp37